MLRFSDWRDMSSIVTLVSDHPCPPDVMAGTRDYYGREVPPLLMFRQVQLPAAGEGSTSGRREGFTIRTNLTAIEGKRLLQPRSPLGRDEGADTCPLIPQPLLDLI